MKRSMPRLATVSVALAMMAGAAQAQATALSAQALAQCASQALQLRSESPRLTHASERMENERASINQRSAELKAQAAATPRDDLRAQLELRERRNAHNARARDFNARIESLKREIDGLNLVKDDYERSCANRPYRHADLAGLPPAAQEAMRMGMTDVEVPYIAPPGIRQADASP